MLLEILFYLYVLVCGGGDGLGEACNIVWRIVIWVCW